MQLSADLTGARSLSTGAADSLVADPDVLVAAARRASSLEDFGPNNFDEALRVMLTAILEEGNYTDQGLARALPNIVRHLSTRLQLQDFFARHPEIERQEIVAPVVIVGLQRTGTSKLFRNIAADPQWNVLYTWQALNPIPPVGWEPGMPDQRLAAAEVWCQQQSYMSKAHKFEARAPEMEAMLMSQTFMVNSGMYLIPSHEAWLERADFVPLYRHLKRQLQFLQWQNRAPTGRRWILKSPAHLLALDALKHVFPDASFVMTHRHPRSSVGSMFKLVDITQQQVARSVNRPLIRDQWLQIMSYSVGNFMRFRQKVGMKSVIDVSFRDLVGDPLPAIRRIYEFAQVPYTKETESAALAWHRDNPQHSEGKFEYDLADYSATDADIESAFSDYIRTYANALAS
jgi:hypothetical protein